MLKFDCEHSYLVLRKKIQEMIHEKIHEKIREKIREKCQGNDG